MHEIRLINVLKGNADDPVCCELQYTSLINPTPYEALSYAWGRRDHFSQILVDGCSIDVTSNLLSALRRLRSSEKDRLLWVDYVCIDQQNIQEKNSQVTQMFQVYSKASVVVIWLGEHDDNSETAVNILKDFETHPDTILWLTSSSREQGHVKSLINVWKLCSRSFFSRIWVIQEVLAAATPTLYCGDSTVSYHTLIKFCKAARDHVGVLISNSAEPYQFLGLNLAVWHSYLHLYKKAIQSALFRDALFLLFCERRRRDITWS